MLAPTVTANFIPTAAGVPALQIVGPAGGGQSAPQTFCAIGYFDDGISAITVTLYNASGAVVFTGAATLRSAYNFWFCRVTVPGPSSSSSSSSSSPNPVGSSSSRSSSSQSSGSGSPAMLSLGIYRLDATPDVGTGDSKTNVVIDPSLASQSCAQYAVPESGPVNVAAAAVVDTSYVQFPYTYPDPLEPTEPRHEVIVGSWAHKNAAGKMEVYNYPPIYTDNPTPSRNYWLPYYGAGIYFARFVRVEAFGGVHTSQTFAKPRA